jgi:hypothetical protein
MTRPSRCNILSEISDYQPNLQIITCGDININYLVDTNKKKQHYVEFF